MSFQWLANHVLALENEIVGSIQMGHAWELWLQIELLKRIFKETGKTASEIIYPGTKKAVDIVVPHSQGLCCIEIKVESPTNAGQFSGEALTTAVGNDMRKLQTLTLPGVTERWALVVAYSQPSKEKLHSLANDAIPALYVAGKHIGVAVFDATAI